MLLNAMPSIVVTERRARFGLEACDTIRAHPMVLEVSVRAVAPLIAGFGGPAEGQRHRSSLVPVYRGTPRIRKPV